MTDKQLTSAESLALIEKMIANTRSNFSRGGGTMFLIWGYTTIGITLAFALLARTGNPALQWLWAAIPVIGGLCSWLYLHKNPASVTTHLDKSVGMVWGTFAGSVVCCLAAFYIQKGMNGNAAIDMPFVVALLLGMATAITGRMINYFPVQLCGMAGIGLAMGLPTIPEGMRQIGFFAMICLFVMVIPGHLLNAAARREERGGTKKTLQ